MLGERESSMSKYVAALHVYEDVGGKLHTSYASTLANLGVLYKDLARDASGLERQQLLERSSEALGDALSIRTSLLGEPICSMRSMYLAAVLYVSDRSICLPILQDQLTKTPCTPCCTLLVCAA